MRVAFISEDTLKHLPSFVAKIGIGHSYSNSSY